jgi:hypothetical protein
VADDAAGEHGRPEEHASGSTCMASRTFATRGGEDGERRAWLGRALHGLATGTRRTRRALSADDDLDGGGVMERPKSEMRETDGACVLPGN